MKPIVLMVNDDGINAPGLKHLFHALKDKVDLTVVAPLHEKSGAGLSMTLTKPLRILKKPFEGIEAFTVNGTPADCVKLALTSLYETPPDLIVSGINRGSNAGRNVLYSGTIGGVIEGVYRNSIQGIAFSSCEYENTSYEPLQKYVYPIIQHVLEHPLPTGTFLNVNFPRHTESPVKGLKFAKQGRSFWTDNPDKRSHPEGDHYYWLGGKWRDHDEEPESDVHLLGQGYISAVPIHVNELTDHNHFEKHKTIFEDYFDEYSF